MTVIEGILIAMGGYLALGLPIAIWFLLAGVRKVDANAMSWGARVVLLPSCCALWPVLITKWVRA